MQSFLNQINFLIIPIVCTTCLGKCNHKTQCHIFIYKVNFLEVLDIDGYPTNVRFNKIKLSFKCWDTNLFLNMVTVHCSEDYHIHSKKTKQHLIFTRKFVQNFSGRALGGKKLFLSKLWL